MGKNNKREKPVANTPVETEVIEEVVEEVVEEVLEEAEVVTEEVTEELTPEPVIGFVSNCDRLNVREKPFKGSNVLTILGGGCDIIINEHLSTETFYHVQTRHGIQGFCQKDYISIQ